MYKSDNGSYARIFIAESMTINIIWPLPLPCFLDQKEPLLLGRESISLTLELTWRGIPVPAMFPSSYCKRLTLSWLEAGQVGIESTINKWSFVTLTYSVSSQTKGIIWKRLFIQIHMHWSKKSWMIYAFLFGYWIFTWTSILSFLGSSQSGVTVQL